MKELAQGSFYIGT